MTALASAKTDTIRATHLQNLTTTHILLLITTLLTLLMLLWHISTAHLIDNYGMPHQWEKDFLRMQFKGGKGVLWGFLFVAVPLDCLHALLALDWYHGCRCERGRDDDDVHAVSGAERARMARRRESEKEEKCTASPKHASAAATSTPANAPAPLHTSSMLRQRISSHCLTSEHASTRPAKRIEEKTNPEPPLPNHHPHTHHPLFSRHLPPAQKFWLHLAYDTLQTSLLVTHIAIFISTLPYNLASCTATSFAAFGPECKDAASRASGRGYDAEQNRHFSCNATDPYRTNRTMRERCERITMDIHVSGPFSVALCAALVGLHVYLFLYRVYERVVCTPGGFAPETMAAEETQSGTRGLNGGVPNVKDEDHVFTPTLNFFSGTSLASERGSGIGRAEGNVDPLTGVKLRDWSVGRGLCTAQRERRFGSVMDGSGGGSGRRDEGRRERRRNRDSSSGEGEGWNLLECLVP